MFEKENSYSYNYRSNRKYKEGQMDVIEHSLTFFDKFNEKYIVRVEEYREINVFVVKFYLARHKDKQNPYQALSKLNNPSRVIGTIIEIMVDFYNKNTNASFGFVGINLEGESKVNTKRFRIYKKIMELFFPPNKFLHYSNPSQSAYLLLNREQASQKRLEHIANFFNEIYILDNENSDN